MKDGSELRLTKTETVLGWLYLPLHAVILPLLLDLYAAVNPDASPVMLNLGWYAAGAVYVVCALYGLLRRGFDALLDAPWRCVRAMASSLLAIYGLSLLLSMLLLALRPELSNPNNTAAIQMAGLDYGATRAMLFFLAPLVEEALFRGVAFGSLRARSRALAYLVSGALFCLYHVWQYVVLTGNAAALLYALQYVPHAFALAWCYERTGSIWTPVFLHMLLNAFAFLVLSNL